MYDVVKTARQKQSKYSKNAYWHQFAYFASEAAAVILLLSAPILALSKLPLWAAISSSGGAVAGLSTRYGWRRNWIQCQKISQEIDYEIELFELKQNSQNSNEDKEKQQVQLFKTIHDIELKHMEDWTKYVPSGEIQNGTQANNTQNQEIPEPHRDEDATDQQETTEKQQNQT